MHFILTILILKVYNELYCQYNSLGGECCNNVIGAKDVTGLSKPFHFTNDEIAAKGRIFSKVIQQVRSKSGSGSNLLFHSLKNFSLFFINTNKIWKHANGKTWFYFSHLFTFSLRKVIIFCQLFHEDKLVTE